MLNILLADDDRGDRMHLRRVINSSGLACALVETETIEEAIAACETREFDCAIVDYRMPGLNGLEGIRALHEGRPFMPIIMATGQGDEAVATEAMKLGAQDYIGKTRVNPDSMRRAIAAALEKAALRRKVAEQQEELAAFAAVLVHDLKAPLTSIQAFARFAETSLKAETIDREQASRHVNRIVQGAGRMDALIKALAAYTKSDADAAFEAVPMRRVVEDALANLEENVRERGAMVTCDALPTVIGNAPLLTQLVQNLISNAIKYCEATPTIHIAAAPVEADPGLWRISVKDNGIGIPAEHAEEIFHAFKRLHGTGKYDGTGLGLATCRKIVARHGGTIWCESEEGRGSAFFFTLPAAQK